LRISAPFAALLLAHGPTASAVILWASVLCLGAAGSALALRLLAGSGRRGPYGRAAANRPGAVPDSVPATCPYVVPDGAIRPAPRAGDLTWPPGSRPAPPRPAIGSGDTSNQPAQGHAQQPPEEAPAPRTLWAAWAATQGEESTEPADDDWPPLPPAPDRRALNSPAPRTAWAASEAGGRPIPSPGEQPAHGRHAQRRPGEPH
jgi:hypothetical protein